MISTVEQANPLRVQFELTAGETVAIAHSIGVGLSLTPAEQFVDLVAHMVQTKEQAYREYIDSIAATVYQTVLVAGTPEEKAFLAQMREKYVNQGG